jgi:hypothetical protein
MEEPHLPRGGGAQGGAQRAGAGRDLGKVDGQLGEARFGMVDTGVAEPP